MALYITKNEVAFFVTLFLLLFVVNSHALLLVVIGLFSFFLIKRKEIYFLWSIIAPRITGAAPILEYLLDLAREEGPGNKELNDLLRIDIPFLKPMFFVFKPAHLKRILSLEADNFPSRGYTGVMVKIAMGGDNILLSEGPPNPHWATFREITSGINKDRFGDKSIVSQMFDATWKATQELTHRFDTKRGQNLDLFYELYHVMIPAHNRALFGEEFARKFTYTELSDEIYGVITETGKQLKFAFSPPANEKILLGQTKRVSDAIRNMSKGSTSPFLAGWLEAHRKGLLSDEQLQSNLLIFEYAQAPLHVVFWALYLLALHPEEEKKVINEIATVLSKGPMSHSRLDEFKFLSRVMTEAIRLYPGVGLMQVRFPKTNTMLGSHFVPEGSFILLCTYLIHRNASYWPNPDDFDPMREGLDTTHSGELLTHIPFGFGPRMCQGQYFAQDFVKVTLISMLQHHKISLAPGQSRARPTEIGFLRPAYPVYFNLDPRVLPVPKPIDVQIANTSASSIQVPNQSQQQSLSQSLLQPQQSSSSQSRLLQLQQGVPGVKKRGAPPRLSKESKTHMLHSQSQIFKESFISIGKFKNNTKDLLVLYGSQSGQARGFAMRVVHMANLCKLSATPLSLAELNVSIIPEYKNVIICTSTYGDGGPPENAEKFNTWLEKQPVQPIASWGGVNYAVLSLGSSMYPYPFKFGHFVSRRIGELGAKRLIPEGILDEIKYNQQEEFTRWSVQLFEAISQNQQESKNLVARNKVLGFQNFDFSLLNAPLRLSFSEKRLKIEPRTNFAENVILASVSTNQLVNADPVNKLYSLELKYSDGALSFQVGDNVSVTPSNDPVLVERFIERLGFGKDLVFNVVDRDFSSVDLSCSLGKNKCTLEIALTYYYDIASPPSASLLQFFAMYTTEIEDQNMLTSYASNYLSFLRLEYNALDVLEFFPSVTLFKNDAKKDEETLALLLGILGPIRPRYYSVASSPHVTQNAVRIVYKHVSYKTRNGLEKHGVCSSYLKSRVHGQSVAVAVSKSKFKLPAETEKPIIMVGAGSGISPYFGFVEQREYIKNKESDNKLGKAVLIHGCRSADDFALKHKVDNALAAGVLTDLWPAYSKQEGVTLKHVQDVIKHEGATLWNMIQSEGAYVFICGDFKIGRFIREALMDVAIIHGKLTIFQANLWFDKALKSGMIRHDEWGVSTHSGVKVLRAARLRLWRKSITAALAFHHKKKLAVLPTVLPTVPTVLLSIPE